jgi:CubicO group peptidase (beta-lactamase class C family)
MHQFWLWVLACLLTSTVPASSVLAQRTPQASKPDQATIELLQRRVPELMKEAEVPGLALALIRDGRTYWIHNFGVRDAKTGQPVTDETIFEAASLSKPVFAYGVLKLVDSGKLHLDKPLSAYLAKPYIQNDPRLDKITARIVLSHRTGFPNWRGNANALTIRFTPGERFSYSGEGFVYLQKVVEQLTAKPLNEYMQETVFGPLGMTSSSYVWRPDYDARTAAGHDSGGEPGEKDKPKDANAAASLHTTAGDYARFLEALLEGKGLRAETWKEMEKPQVAVDPECTNCTDRTLKGLSKNVFWGLGVGIQQTPDGESLWHWGDNGAFKAYMVVYAKQKFGLVMFANGQNGLSIAQEIVHQAIGGELPAFRWIKYDAYDSAAMKFARATRQQGPRAAIAEYRPALMRGDVSEDSINSLGYQLIGQKKPEEALRIFQLNVQLHPDSWNAYDSLGEAYMNHGDKELAIQNYQKSLELNPRNTGAEKALKKLKEEPGDKELQQKPAGSDTAKKELDERSRQQRLASYLNNLRTGRCNA